MKTSNRKKAIPLTVIFFITFSIMCVLYYKVQFLNEPFMGFMVDEKIVMAFFSLMASFFITLLAALFVFNIPLSLRFIQVAIILYILILCFVLFGKSIGITGVNLDVFNEDVFSPGLFLNILVFIPAGFLLRTNFKNPWKAVAIGFVLSALIECIQLVFRLGIFDILDIIANTSGMALGILYFQLFRKCGLEIACENNKIKLHEIDNLSSSPSKIAAYSITIASLLVLCITPLIIRDSESSTTTMEDNTIPLSETNSEILFNLKEGAYINDSTLAPIQIASDFDFNIPPSSPS